MIDIIRIYNPMVRFSKFTSNKKIKKKYGRNKRMIIKDIREKNTLCNQVTINFNHLGCGPIVRVLVYDRF